MLYKENVTTHLIRGSRHRRRLSARSMLRSNSLSFSLALSFELAGRILSYPVMPTESRRILRFGSRLRVRGQFLADILRSHSLRNARIPRETDFRMTTARATVP